MKRAWKPTTAGIMLILIGGLTLLTRILLHLNTDWYPNVFLVFALFLGIVTIIGSYFAIQRRVWGLALAGAICSMIVWIEGVATAIA